MKLQVDYVCVCVFVCMYIYYMRAYCNWNGGGRLPVHSNKSSQKKKEEKRGEELKKKSKL